MDATLGKKKLHVKGVWQSSPAPLGINSWQKAEVSWDPYVSTNRDLAN